MKKIVKVINDNGTIADKIESLQSKGWKFVKCEEIHDDTDIPRQPDRDAWIAQKARLHFEKDLGYLKIVAEEFPDKLITLF